MTPVRHRDLLALVRGLETLYGAADMPSLAGRVTRCLRELFDCELASFDLIDLSAVHWNTLVVSPAIPNWEAFLQALQRHAHEHPIVTHAARHSYAHAIRISDLTSLRQYRRTGLYNEMCVPYVASMDRQLGFVAKPSATLAFGASVNRRGKDFSAEQRTLLELLRPHLLQAYLIAQAAAQIHERERAEREDVAAAVDGGLCQIDATGKIEWMTAKVGPLLARYFPASHGRPDHLPPELRALLRAALAPERKSAAARPSPGRTWEFPRPAGALTVSLAGKGEAGRWQLLLREEAREPTPEMLAARHGLTRREGETLFWISQGKTYEEIGIILSISKRTAHKHAERVFEKMNVDNRTAAARECRR